MKRLFSASILLNLAFVATFGVLLIQSHRRIRQLALLPQNEQPAVAQTVIRTNASAAEILHASPFRWQQLESSDYRTYIANLRGVGCPEQTIRDIITADVDALYAPKRNDLSQNFGGPELARRDEQLRRDEAELLVTLLGNSPEKTSVASTNFTPERKTRTQDRIELPLVLRNLNLNALKLDAPRSQIIGELRQEFIERIGGENQNPDDPAYRKRWETAQPDVDEQLKAAIGFNAYQELQAQGNSSP